MKLENCFILILIRLLCFRFLHSFGLTVPVLNLWVVFLFPHTLWAPILYLIKHVQSQLKIAFQTNKKHSSSLTLMLLEFAEKSTLMGLFSNISQVGVGLGNSSDVSMFNILNSDIITFNNCWVTFVNWVTWVNLLE